MESNQVPRAAVDIGPRPRDEPESRDTSTRMSEFLRDQPLNLRQTDATAELRKRTCPSGE